VLQHATAVAIDMDMDSGVREHRFTVEEFLRMGEAGILGPDLRVELLDGRVYEMAPIGSPHAACVNRLTRLFTGAFGASVVVAVQNPVHIGDYTQLVADVAVLRPRDDFYAARHPRPADVLLLTEVADTTLLRDRRVKMPVYGRAGIVESWLVDVNARRIQVFRAPSSELGYEHATVTNIGETLTPLSFSELTIGAEEILGAS
jgi:hypothetical protein